MAVARQAQAHPEGLSLLTVMVEEQRVRAQMVLPASALPAIYPAPPGQPEADYPAYAAAKLKKDAADVLELRLNYSPVAPSSSHARVEAGDAVLLEMEFPATTPTGGPVTALQVYSNKLPQLAEGHRQVLEVRDARGLPADPPLPIDGGRVIARRALTAGRYTVFVNVPPVGQAPATEAFEVAGTESGGDGSTTLLFFRVGVGHILGGYDHLLFLAALLLVCRSLGEAAKIITCFTVAHSITLALAALDVVRLPSRVVEPMIAASIVYVAAENLWSAWYGTRPSVVHRAAITFGFGLVHGLGFASALRESGLGSASRGIVGPLVQFNLGVEAGQLAVAAVIFPLLLYLRKRPVFERRWVPACSAFVAAAGAWWLVHRVAFV
jgi:hydrogenase/urease accessory protein HupE